MSGFFASDFFTNAVGIFVGVWVFLIVVGYWYSYYKMGSRILNNLMGYPPEEERPSRADKEYMKIEQEIAETERLLDEFNEEKAQRNAEAKKRRQESEQRWRSKLNQRD